MDRIDEKDADLPTGPIELPKETPSTELPITEPAVPVAQPPPGEPDVVPAAPAVVMAPDPKQKPPEDTSTLGILKARLQSFQEDGIAWFKTHKLLGTIILLLTFGFLLYFWPLITCALVAQHMLKNTKGTVNKGQMYKIVAVLLVISLSIQAIWIVQLAQASSFR